MTPPPRRRLPPHDPARDALHRERFQRTGMVILIAGLSAAILVLLFAKPQPPPSFDEPNVNNSKVYEQNVERLGGKSAILGMQLGDWWTARWHGRNLAYTLITLSATGAGVCFFFAYLLGLPPREE